MVADEPLRIRCQMGKTMRPAGSSIRIIGLLTVLILTSSCSLWHKLETLAYPENNDDLQALMTLSKPEGIDLVAPTAIDELRVNARILGLHSNGNRFDYFFYFADSSLSNYARLLELNEFHPPALTDGKPGFMIYDFPVMDEKLTGREYYYDKEYKLCNNMLFSRRPLRSTSFVMLVFNKRGSTKVVGREGLLCLYADSKSEVFKIIRKE